MKRYKKALISYENEECINYLFLCKHSKDLDELKKYIDAVMKTRKVYNYKIHSVTDTSEEEIKELKKVYKNE